MCIRDRVILIPSLSYKKEMMIKGIMLEAIERLEAIPNGYFGPSREITGSEEPEFVGKWQHYFNMTRNGAVCYGGYTDPEIFKIVLQRMIEEANVKVYLHSIACRAVCEGAVSYTHLELFRVESEAESVKHLHGLLLSGAFGSVKDSFLFIC